MSMWIFPYIVLTVIVSVISVLSIRKTNEASPLKTGKDHAIPEVIENHPFTLNPIIWAYLIVAAFIFIVIVYYAAIYPW